jgi:hypothetical protein
MTDDQRPDATAPEQSIPPPQLDKGGRAVDDHRIPPHPTGIGHQPTEDLDLGVDDENLSSPSQGVRPETTPNPDRER